MKQLLENTNKKMSLRRSRKKDTSTPCESSPEDKVDDVHNEISSKHNKPSDSDKGGSQCLSLLEKHFQAIVNWEKLQGPCRDRRYLTE